MRKLSLILLSAFLVLGFSIQAKAESSAVGYTGLRYEEQQVFVFAYNNSGASVTSNSVVILDVSATVNSTLGSYFTTTTETDSPYVMGVTDQTIATGAIGRICVRGPHKVWVASMNTSAGDTLGTYTPAGKVETTTSTSNKAGQLGVALAQDTTAEGGLDIWWAWINPGTQ